MFCSYYNVDPNRVDDEDDDEFEDFEVSFNH